jgi:hypothetical protein
VIDPSAPIVPETDCARCRKPVDPEVEHFKFAISPFAARDGKCRIGVVHFGCEPPQGMQDWLDSQVLR